MECSFQKALAKLMKRSLMLMGFWLLATPGALPQVVPFLNLGFESAHSLPPGPGIDVPTTNALPGWTAYIGGVQQDHIFYDDIAISGQAISLHDSGSQNFQPISG